MSYKKKLIIFHDTFVEYALKRIKYQKAKDLDLEIPIMTTALRERFSILSMIPITKDITNIGILISDWWNDRQVNIKIDTLIHRSAKEIKQLLSSAILEIAYHVEPVITKLEEPKDIGIFATEAVIKLIHYLKSLTDKNKEITFHEIAEAVLIQNNWFSNDRFLDKKASDNQNYKFIDQEDITLYSGTKENGGSFSSYIRFKYELDNDVQIVYVGKELTIAGFDLSYKNLNGYEFGSEKLPKISMDNLKTIAQEHREELDKKYQDLLDAQVRLELEVYSSQKNIDQEEPEKILANIEELRNRLIAFYLSQSKLPKFIEGADIVELDIETGYINLVIVNQNEQVIREKNIQGIVIDEDIEGGIYNSDERIYGAKEPIGKEDLFKRFSNEAQDPKKLLVYGRAGIGKTTLMHRLSYDWAKGSLWKDQFKYVFWLPLRKLTIEDWTENMPNKQKTFFSFVYYCTFHQMINDLAGDTVKIREIISYLNIIFSKFQNEILLLIDGFDEVAELYREKEVEKYIINSALSATSYVILTSRPSALNSDLEKKFTRKLENIGLNLNDAEKYIDSYYNSFQERDLNLNERDTLEEKRALIFEIKHRTELKSMARIPLNVFLLCMTWHDSRMKFNQYITTTQLYNNVIFWLVTRYIKKNKDNKFIKKWADENRIDISNPYEIELLKINEILCLEEVAYKAVKDRSIILYKKDYYFTSGVWARIVATGLIKAVGTTNEDYYFIHLTLQEFMAARYLARILGDSDYGEGIRFISEYKYSRSFERTIYFTAGIISNDIHYKSNIAQERFWNIMLKENVDLGIIRHSLICAKCLEESSLMNIFDQEFLLENIKKTLQIFYRDGIIQEIAHCTAFIEKIRIIDFFTNKLDMYVGSAIEEVLQNDELRIDKLFQYIRALAILGYSSRKVVECFIKILRISTNSMRQHNLWLIKLKIVHALDILDVAEDAKTIEALIDLLLETDGSDEVKRAIRDALYKLSKSSTFVINKLLEAYLKDNYKPEPFLPEVLIKLSSISVIVADQLYAAFPRFYDSQIGKLYLTAYILVGCRKDAKEILTENLNMFENVPYNYVAGIIKADAAKAISVLIENSDNSEEIIEKITNTLNDYSSANIKQWQIDMFARHNFQLSYSKYMLGWEVSISLGYLGAKGYNRFISEKTIKDMVLPRLRAMLSYPTHHIYSFTEAGEKKLTSETREHPIQSIEKAAEVFVELSKSSEYQKILKEEENLSVLYDALTADIYPWTRIKCAEAFIRIVLFLENDSAEQKVKEVMLKLVSLKGLGIRFQNEMDDVEKRLIQLLILSTKILDVLLEYLKGSISESLSYSQIKIIEAIGKAINEMIPETRFKIIDAFNEIIKSDEVDYKLKKQCVLIMYNKLNVNSAEIVNIISHGEDQLYLRSLEKDHSNFFALKSKDIILTVQAALDNPILLQQLPQKISNNGVAITLMESSDIVTIHGNIPEEISITGNSVSEIQLKKSEVLKLFLKAANDNSITLNFIDRPTRQDVSLVQCSNNDNAERTFFTWQFVVYNAVKICRVFKALDIKVNILRLAHIPTPKNAKTVLLDSAHIYSMYTGINLYSSLVIGVDISYKLYNNEHDEAINQFITLSSFMFFPMAIEYSRSAPITFIYIAGITVYSLINAIVNVYSFYQEYSESNFGLKSITAYKNLFETLSNSPLQYTYDFISKAKEYEIKLNYIKLELEKNYIKGQLEEKGEFGQKLYEYIYAPMIEEKYELLKKVIQGSLTQEEAEVLKDKHIQVMGYNHCTEIIELKAEVSDHYYCYNEDQQILDHVVIIGDDYVTKISSL